MSRFDLKANEISRQVYGQYSDTTGLHIFRVECKKEVYVKRDSKKRTKGWYTDVVVRWEVWNGEQFLKTYRERQQAKRRLDRENQGKARAAADKVVASKVQVSQTRQHYQQVRADARAANDNRYCTVNALAILSGESYWTAAAHLKRHAGRQHRRGVPTSRWLPAYQKLLNLKEVTNTVRNSYGVRTIGSFEKACFRGAFLIKVRGHVIPVIDGEVYDWTADGRRHIIQQVWKVA